MDLATIASYYDDAPAPAPRDASSPSGGTRASTRDVKRLLPKKQTLDYTNAAITALVLVLALPWLLRKLVTDPGEVIAAAGRKQVKG